MVIITLGRDGAVFASSDEPRPIHVRPPKVEEVLDTTVRFHAPFFVRFRRQRLAFFSALLLLIMLKFHLQGAGDAFVGALAHYLARYPDFPLFRKVGGAVQIATMSVQQYGTQTSYPLAKDLRFDIGLRNFDWSYV